MHMTSTSASERIRKHCRQRGKESMWKKIKFTILGNPNGKGRPRFSTNTGRAYTPKKTTMYENLVRIEYGIQCNNFRFDDDAMLDMRILAFYEIPKSTSKKKRNLMLSGMLRPTKKPDMDNVVKIIADSLNKVAYRDDTQIVDCQCRKFYSDTPRVEVIIAQYGIEPQQTERKGMNA